MKKKIFVGIIFIIAMLALQGMLGTTKVKAETIRGSEESVSWIFDSETGVITFSGSGNLTGNWRNSIENSFVNVKKIIVEDGITKLEQFSFNGCNNVVNIDIPDSVTYIDAGVFSGCESLQSIKIPDNITEESESLVSSWFGGCESLTDIIIGKNNKYLCCENNVIFSKDKTKLLWYNDSKKDTSYIIPNSVSVIGSGAVGSHNLIDIQIPNSVTIIESGAFSDCIGLKKVIIPNSVTSIGTWAFGHCTSLEKIIVPNSVTSLESGIFIYSDDCKIYCKSDSKMKTYAEENKLNYVIDDDVPTITLTQEGTYIKVSATDTGVGLASAPYSIGNDKWLENERIAVENSGEYTIYVKDKLDNITQKTIIVDLDKPTITEALVNQYTITITATDNVALADKPYSINGKDYQSSNVFTVNENGTYTIYVKDKAENISNKLVIIEEKADNNGSVPSNKPANENGNGNNNSNQTPAKDDTQAPSKLPQTGTISMISIFILLGAIVIFSYNKFKKNNY